MGLSLVSLMVLMLGLTPGQVGQAESVGVARSAPLAQSEIAALLLDYDRGAFAETEARLRGIRDLEELRLGLAAAAAKLPKGAQVPDTVVRRRLVMAAVGLEAANMRGLGNAHAAFELLEFSCQLIRQSTAGPAEYAWQMAALAIFEAGGGGPTAAVHVEHVLPRFPDDPRLLLARGVVAELSTFPDQRESDATLLVRKPDEALDAERYLRAAAKHPEVHDEATVRLGLVLLRMGRTIDARAQLAPVAAGAADADLKYLASLFLGRVEDRLNEPDAAVAAYRSAVDAAPGAQTAAMGLAAALARAGNREEARRVAAAATASPPGRDPWFDYGLGEARAWPALIARLRSALQ